MPTTDERDMVMWLNQVENDGTWPKAPRVPELPVIARHNPRPVTLDSGAPDEPLTLAEMLAASVPAWQAEGLCRWRPDINFFPERGDNTRDAKAVCRGCPVRPECLEYALDNGDKFGIWGGMSERERRRLRQAHNRERHALQQEQELAS